VIRARAEHDKLRKTWDVLAAHSTLDELVRLGAVSWVVPDHKSCSHTDSHTATRRSPATASRCRASLPLLGSSRRPPEVNQDSPDPAL
jgi:hypothetical protein